MSLDQLGKGDRMAAYISCGLLTPDAVMSVMNGRQHPLRTWH